MKEITQVPTSCFGLTFGINALVELKPLENSSFNFNLQLSSMFPHVLLTSVT
jgi:hypothetical protein